MFIAKKAFCRDIKKYETDPLKKFFHKKQEKIVREKVKSQNLVRKKNPEF